MRWSGAPSVVVAFYRVLFTLLLLAEVPGTATVLGGLIVPRLLAGGVADLLGAFGDLRRGIRELRDRVDDPRSYPVPDWSPALVD